MSIRTQTQSAFNLISASSLKEIISQPTIVQNNWSQNPFSTNTVILTLKKFNIIARSNSNISSEKVFTAQINFDLKFQIIYFEQKNISSRKIGIKFETDLNTCNYFYADNTETINTWVHQLSRLINQKGFHQIFKPIRKLGKGNFASVYQVQRLTDHKKFAVKAFSKQNTYNAKNGRQSLINELSIMRSLNHSNVLKLEGVFESDNSIYVVMEVLSGDQLFNRIQKNKGYFKKIQIKAFMKCLLEGLNHLHQKRIMHRDLKPQNIMLRNQSSFEPVIVDFGLATNVDICGTPGYVAPEIVTLTDNSHVQPKCDIFSAGVIFHILLTRKPLFEGSKYDEVYKNNKQMNFDLNSEQYGKIESEQFELLKKMLMKDPNQRISAADALNHNYFNELNPIEYQKIQFSSKMTQASDHAPKIRKLIKF